MNTIGIVFGLLAIYFILIAINTTLRNIEKALRGKNDV